MNTRHAFYGRILALFFLGLGTMHSSGAVNLVFSGTPGSSVINYAISGSGTFNAGGTNNMIVIVALSSDPFDAIFAATSNYGITGTGTLTNTTTAQSTSLVNIRFDDDGGPGEDDLRLDFNSNITVTNGDLYTISGSGTFDVSVAGATVSDFNAGTGSGIVTGSGLVVDGVNLTVTPEPSRAMLSALGLAALALRRNRRARSLRSEDW